MVLVSKRDRENERKLLVAIKKGGRELDKAISYLLENYELKITSYLKSKYGNVEDAQDTLHDGLAAMILNIRNNKFKGDSSLYSYLFSICKHIQFKKIRRDVSKENWENDVLKESEDSNAPDVELIQSEMKEFVTRMMSKLDEKCRKVLNLWSLHYSMTEIAQQLEYGSPQVAMNKKNSCMKKFSTIVNNEDNETHFWK